MTYQKQRKGRSWSADHPATRQQRRKKLVRRKLERRNWRDTGGVTPVNWRLYSHRRLWDMIKSAEPPQLGYLAHRWGKTAEDVDEATAHVHQIVQKLMLSWRGPSAVQAAAAVSALTDWATEASRTAFGVGRGLDAYTSAVQHARNKMPEPVHYYAERWFNQGYDVSALNGPNGLYMADDLLDDHLPTKQEAREAKEKAVHVMEEYESASRDAHDGLPQPFAAAPGVTNVRPDPASVGEPDPEQDTGRNTDPIPHLGPPVPGPQTGTSTAAVGLVDVGPGSGGGGGYGSATGVPGAGSGDGGAGLRAGIGPTTTSVPGAVGTMSSGLRGGSPGSTFYPAAGGAGTRRDEDKEHKNKWCQGLDLLDDLPAAYPSVLGEH